MYKIANYNHCSSKFLGFLDRTYYVKHHREVYISPCIAGSSSPRTYPEPFIIQIQDESH